ncbi:MAG: hypothetical protein HZB41_05470 [Ignavibacteriae bacterium]|nr:hypothetical protein [Ignavibacteriota bacterium]
MRNSTISIPLSQIVDLLKALPRKKVIEIFNEVIVSYDSSPLTKKEKNLIKESVAEYKAGEMVAWENIN